MSIANEVNEIIQRRNNKVHILEEHENYLRKIYENLEILQKQKKCMLENSGNLKLSNEVLDCIQELDIRPYQTKWNEVQRKIYELRERFSRETINIAVIGGARQGKSKLLQSISGLDDRVIPAFSTSDCTGTTSMIKNVPGRTLSAEISFRTEREMMQVVQTYLDKMLGEGIERIESFQEIKGLKKKLEEIEKKLEGSPESAKFEHLKKYVNEFEEWSDYVQKGKTEIVTNPDEIKKFVAQHNGKTENDPDRENYFRYLAVKKAVVSCEFNYADAGKIILQDTIGLGDTSIGIEQAMFDTLQRDSDAAIIVKRPEVATGKIDSKDVELYAQLSKKLNSRNMGKWLFWLINNTKGLPYGDNTDRCQAVKEKIKNYGWDLAGYEVVDVSDQENVNDGFLRNVLTTLVKNIDSIDEGLVNELNFVVEEMYFEYKNLQEKIQGILFSELKNSVNVSDYVDKKWREFYKDGWAKKLREYKENWKEKASEENVKYREYIEEILLNARKDIPDIDTLVWELEAGATSGQAEVYIENINKLRTGFTEKFLDIDEEIFEDLIRKMKEDIVDIFANEDGARMKFICMVNENRPKGDWLSYAIEEIFIKEDDIQIKKAFHVLENFKLTVRGFLMHKVRVRVSRLEPENGELYLSNAGSKEDKAKEIRRILDKKLKETCEELMDELSEIYREPHQIVYSIIQEFYDRLGFSVTSGYLMVENRWKSLYREYCTKVWEDEFKDQKMRSEIYGKWEQLRNELFKYSKADFDIHLSNS